MLIRSAVYVRSAYASISCSITSAAEVAVALSSNAASARAELASLSDQLRIAKEGRGAFWDKKIPRPLPEKVAAVAELASRAGRLAEEAQRLQEDAVRELAGLEMTIQVNERGVYG